MITDLGDRLRALAAESPKHWPFALRRDAALLAAVHEATLDLDEAPLAHRAYAAATASRPTCAEGRVRPLKSFAAGWGFCGRAGACACARRSVSASVRAAKSAETADQKAEASRRRAATNLAKHGVANIGQAAAAREAHAAFYADAERSRQAAEKGAATMLARHGVDNALKLPKVTAIRPTIAASLTPEQRASRAEKRAALTARGDLLRLSHKKLLEKYAGVGLEWLCAEGDYRRVQSTRQQPFRCTRCNMRFETYIDNQTPWCPECDKSTNRFKSNGEDEVAAFVEGLGFEVKRSVRYLLKNREIDILVPSAHLAIEYGGLYWHSEFGAGKDRKYHRDKMDRCAAAGIRLVTIFADEWDGRREASEGRLRHLLGRSLRRVHARATTCGPITGRESAGFLNRFHVQGAGTPASVNIGLREGERLVAVMTFGRPRVGRNQIAKAEWEMYRFACADAVVGGASRMFAAFVRSHDPASVLTYADLRWGHGGVYERMGFVPQGRTEPNYWWMRRYEARLPRQNFTKAKLVAEGFTEGTEEEIMLARRHDRIWDCGSARFFWRKSGS